MEFDKTSVSVYRIAVNEGNYLAKAKVMDKNNADQIAYGDY